MKRKYIFQLAVLMALGMGVLLSMVAFDLPGFRREREPLELSVIIREQDSGGWAAARQGMEQAAVDFRAELRFLTLSEANHAREQAALLLREVEGGADGIILAPADTEALSETVKLASSRTAVITMESDMSGSGAAACVSVDNTRLGRALGLSAINGVPEGGKVLLLDSAPGSSGVSDRLAEAGRVLRAAGREAIPCRPAAPQDLGESLIRALGVERPGAVVAFEPCALETAVRLSREAENPPLVYGMGATGTIASYLERGSITAIAAQNEFAAGYLAVQAAAGAAGGTARPGIEPMDFSIIRQENMYAAENQKLLFPVTR